MYTGFKQYQYTIQDTEDNVGQLRKLFYDEQLKIVKQTNQFLRILSKVPSVKGLELSECNEFLQAIHRENPQYSTLVVANGEGMINCCAIPLKKPINVADRSWFRRISKSREFVIDNFLISRSSKKASLPFAYPILSSDGKTLVAAVGAAFNLEYYRNVFESVPLPRDSVILVTDRTGNLLYKSLSHQASGNQDCLGEKLEQCRGFKLPDTRKGKLEVRDADGKDRIYWFERLSVGQETNEICLLIGISKQALFSGVKQMLLINIAMLCVVAFSSFIIAWFFGGKFILNPVNRLLERTRLVQKGDLSIPESIGELPGELEILSRAFDDMVLDLYQKGKDRDEAYTIINNSPLVGFIWSNQSGWPIEFVTENIENVFGYSPDELRGNTIRQAGIVFPDDLERVQRETVRFSREKKRETFAHTPYRVLTKSGDIRWVDHRVYIKRDPTGSIRNYHGILLDITERRQAEEEIQNLRNYLSKIIDSMPSVLIGVDKEGRVTQWNRKARSVTKISRESAEGKPFEENFPGFSSDLERVKNAVKSAVNDHKLVKDLKVTWTEGEETRYQDITIFPLVDGNMGGAVIRIDDITEKVRMEEVLIQNEKILSVGGLAAGMAHEINNPLAGVLQNIDVLETRLTGMTIPANQSAAASVGTSMESIAEFMNLRGIPRIIHGIKDSGFRMASIVKNMLDFSRKENTSFSSHHPTELMDKILELASADYDLKKQYDFKSILIQKEYEPDLPMISCEGSKIQQVLLNILNNGAHAMFARGEKEEMPPPKFILRLSHKTGLGMLQIEVEDNGTGMDAKTRKKIFDPFFTTKPAGVGTGLGLSVSYFIIKENHGGTMDVVSEPGKGTNFIIRLPVEQKSRK
ncbi:PAS domain S-box protein [Desulfospira joergensenii]|uniref:PAS domain S-box protein n=1 Tax=Desulfospira joergensenii TaxID=53329 RepID=UPI0013772863|nr:PAS domain S-box protein [Desulfospira joergensenii]